MAYFNSKLSKKKKNYIERLFKTKIEESKTQCGLRKSINQAKSLEGGSSCY